MMDQGEPQHGATDSDHTRAPETSAAAYVEQAAALLGLAIAAEHRAGVAANVARLHATAAPLLEFPLSAEIEAAPVFEP